MLYCPGSMRFLHVSQGLFLAPSVAIPPIDQTIKHSRHGVPFFGHAITGKKNRQNMEVTQQNQLSSILHVIPSYDDSFNYTIGLEATMRKLSCVL